MRKLLLLPNLKTLIMFQTSLAAKSQTIDGEPVLVTGIQREIESISDLPTTWHSHFDRYGYVTACISVSYCIFISHQQEGPTIIEINIKLLTRALCVQ